MGCSSSRLPQNFRYSPVRQRPVEPTSALKTGSREFKYLHQVSGETLLPRPNILTVAPLLPRYSEALGEFEPLVEYQPDVDQEQVQAMTTQRVPSAVNVHASDLQNSCVTALDRLTTLFDVLQHIRRRKVTLVMTACSGVVFRCTDNALDFYAGAAFWYEDQRWWAVLTILFTFTSPLAQFVYVAYRRNCRAAMPYLLPLSLAHVLGEYRHLRLLYTVPQRALDTDMHEKVGNAVLNKILAGLECAAESLPQALIQCGAYWTLGGDWLMLASIACSLIGVAYGIWLGIDALRNDASASAILVEDNEPLLLSTGCAIAMEGQDLTHTCSVRALVDLLTVDGDVRIFDLSKTNISDSAVASFAKICPRMHRLYLNRNADVSDESILAVAQRCPELQILTLRFTKVTDVSIKEVAMSCPQLDYLSLDSTQVTDISIRLVAKNCVLLTRLYLDSTNVSDEAIQEIAQCCPRLLRLGLASTRVTDASIAEVAQHCSQLQFLGVASTQVTDNSIELLARGCDQIQILVLDSTRVTNQSIIQVARYCTQLERLGLASTAVTDEAIEEVAKRCTQLQGFLRLQSTSVTDQGIKAVARHCCKIKRLGIHSTFATDGSIKEIAMHCHQLEVLNVSYTAVTDEAIYDVVRNCPKLQELSLACTKVTDACIATISQNHQQLRINALS